MSARRGKPSLCLVSNALLSLFTSVLHSSPVCIYIRFVPPSFSHIGHSRIRNLSYSISFCKAYFNVTVSFLNFPHCFHTFTVLKNIYLHSRITQRLCPHCTNNEQNLMFSVFAPDVYSPSS